MTSAELPQVWDQITYLKSFVPTANFCQDWVSKVETKAESAGRALLAPPKSDQTTHLECWLQAVTALLLDLDQRVRLLEAHPPPGPRPGASAGGAAGDHAGPLRVPGAQFHAQEVQLPEPVLAFPEGRGFGRAASAESYPGSGIASRFDWAPERSGAAPAPFQAAAQRRVADLRADAQLAALGSAERAARASGAAPESPSAAAARAAAKANLLLGPQFREPPREADVEPEPETVGDGSWGRAFLAAAQQGPHRKQAFDLLYRSEIVTRHEMCDSAIVPTDHIEECVTIALEMLAADPLEVWLKDISLCKQQFEKRLAILYQTRFGAA